MTAGYKRWSLVTWLNERHMFFAWISMVWVAGPRSTCGSSRWASCTTTTRGVPDMALELKDLQRVEHDVLVVGAGGAGLRAAVQCAMGGPATGVICKSLLGKAHTVMAEGGMAAALGYADNRDHWKIHFRDTMRGGKFLNDWRMAELHAKRRPRAWWSSRSGAPSSIGCRAGSSRSGTSGAPIPSPRPRGRSHRPGAHPHAPGQGDAHARPRGPHGVHGPRPADGERPHRGALAYWRQTGRFVVFSAKAVILASGGAGKMFRITSNSWEYSGDGYALAYEAGAELIDMEFTQFHPTGMVWPPSVRGTLVTESVRGEGGILKNKDGDRFMFKYIPEKFAKETADTFEEAAKWVAGDKNARRPPELLTRDVVARAINNEVKSGRGSPHGGVFLDIASVRPAEFIQKKLPSMYHQFKELAELDITKEPMEVGPTCHYFMGGVRVDADTQMTKVPRALRRRRGVRWHARREPARRQLALPTSSCSASSRATAPVAYCGSTAEADAPRNAGARERATRDRHPQPRVGREPVPRARRAQDMMQANVGIIRRKASSRRRSSSSRS
jgi:succinate dehydrogenase / fumarate reductase flavoprotein subunit